MFVDAPVFLFSKYSLWYDSQTKGLRNGRSGSVVGRKTELGRCSVSIFVNMNEEMRRYHYCSEIQQDPFKVK